MSRAFDAIADLAMEGRWQAADAAFNVAVDALDAQRPALQAEHGPAAVVAFEHIENLLDDLDVALREEDAPQVRAVTGVIGLSLAQLQSGARRVAFPAAATETVLGWRRAEEAILALAAQGRWRDMRNAAMQLSADIALRGVSVVRASGGDAERNVTAARIFAERLRAAALDQSPDDAALADRFFRQAADDLLLLLGVLPTPEATRRTETRMQFRVFQVEGSVGDVVRVPIKVEGVPQIGLGAYRIRVHWSPKALRLQTVSWEYGAGSILRDDAGGTVELSLPLAPTGPTGEQVLAVLTLAIVGRDIGAAGYLPGDELSALQGAFDSAMDEVRVGDVPKAATILTRAYARLLDARGESGGLYAELARFGLAEPVADRLLNAIDVASRPAKTDETVAAISAAGDVLAGALSVYVGRMAEIADVPVTLEVVATSDTLGRSLPFLEPVPGGIALATERQRGTLTARPTVPPGIGQSVAGEPHTADAGPSAGHEPGTGNDAVAERGAAAASGEQGAGAFAARGVPLVPLAALLAASVLGLVAVWWTSRTTSDSA